MHKSKFIALLLAITSITLTACAGPITAPPQASRQEILQEAHYTQKLIYQKFVEDQTYIYNISFPLIAANAELCGNATAPVLGMKVWNTATVAREFRTAAKELYGVDHRLRIQAVAPNTPAAKAGLKAGDAIISLNGIKIPTGSSAIKTAEQSLKSSGFRQIETVVQRQGNIISTVVQPVRGCAFPVLLNYKDSKINAFADGKRIVIAKGMLRFTENKDEIALVIAHELAHSALRHIDKIKQNATIGMLGGLVLDGLLGSSGQFGQLGGQIAIQQYSVPFEQEADYVGMYFMARAGYNASRVADFWRRMGAEGSSSITQRTSHPTSPERYLAIGRTWKEISNKIKRGQALVPNLKPH